MSSPHGPAISSRQKRPSERPYAADELSAEVAVEQRLLADGSPGREPRSLGGERGAGRVPVVEQTDGLRLAERDRPGLVAQHLPDGSPAFPAAANPGQYCAIGASRSTCPQ